MKIRVVESFGDERLIYCKVPKKKTLGALFEGHEEYVHSVEVNGKWVENWKDHVFQQKDEIVLYSDIDAPAIPFIVSLLISLALQFIAQLLAPKPKKPSASKNQPALGVAGIQNTIAPGTPKFITYGIRKVFGHLIASTVDIIESIGRPDSGKSMSFSALYFMGSGPICGISDVKVNGTHLCDIYGPPEAYARLGTIDQEIIPRHEIVHQVYGDGRPIELKARPSTSKRQIAGYGKPITYTTKGSSVDKVALYFQFPEGLWAFGVHGTRYPNFVTLEMKRKRNDDPPGIWEDPVYYESITTSSQDGFFWKLEIENPTPDRYDYQMRVSPGGHGSFGNSPGMSLFNVEETQYVTTTYPSNALLEVHGVASDQITGFDQMETSALVDGRLVEVLRNGIYVKECSRNRVWIIRDLLLNTEVGLGNRIHASLWDNASSQVAADYYEGLVTGFDDVTEQRDFCDVIINEIRPGWDWIKILLFEGRAALVPTGGRFKYTLDIDRTPELLYSSPGNIIEDSLQYELGTTEKPINTIRAEFPNRSQDYTVVPAKLVSGDIGTDPERPEQVSYVSIVRKSHASREMNFHLKKLTLIKRKWTWKSPRSAIVSEPFDVSYLSYNVQNNFRGFTGLIKGNDSSVNRIVTGKEIYLQSGYTYTAYVRHLNSIETKLVSNTTGRTHSTLNLSTPLSFTPGVGDIWGLSSVVNNIPLVQIDEVETTGDTVVLKVHEHIPLIYIDTLTDVTIGENTSGSTSSTYPPPLLGAQGRTISAGVTVGYLFNVIPSFNSLVGTYSGLTANSLILNSVEPTRDNFFNDAYLTAAADAPKRIVSYAGTSHIALVTSDFSETTPASGTYNIKWQSFGKFDGFEVEGFRGATWSSLGNAVGTSYTVLTSLTYSSFRFTPLSANEIGNTNAQVVVSPGINDSTAPKAPITVGITSDELRNGLIAVNLVGPLERDIQYVQMQWISGLTSTNDSTYVSYADVGTFRDESNTASPQLITGHRDLSAFPYGLTVSAAAATMDYYGNTSVVVPGFNTTQLSAGTTDNPIELILPDGTIPSVPVTGSSIITLYTNNLSGGTLGANNSIQLDLSLLVTAGTTASTFINFYYTYAALCISTITSQIANGSSKISNETPYFLTFRIDPLDNTYNKQITYATKSGTEITSANARNTSSTTNIDSSIDHTLAIYALITGATNSTIEVTNALLRQINGLTGLTSAAIAVPTIQPYLVAGTVPGVLGTASRTVLVHPFSIAASFPQNLATSYGKCLTNAGTTVTISIQKNNVEFGTMQFRSTGSTASFIATQTSFSAGDVMTVVTPVTADVLLSNVGWSFYGTRV